MVKLFVSLLLILCCCSSRPVSVKQIEEYITNEANGLKKTVQMDESTISIAYRPTDLIIQQEISDEHLSSLEVDSIKRKYSDYHYFVVNISRRGKEALRMVDNDEYGELFQTMAFRMPQYVSLTTGSDTILLVDYAIHPTYGASKSTDLMFVFDKLNDSDWIQFNLNEFGLGLGNHRFRFMKRDLAMVPSLSHQLK